MQKNRKIQTATGLLVILSASLEVNAQAGQKKGKTEDLTDVVRPTHAGTDPLRAINGWSTQTPAQNLKSKTLDVQSGGASSLEQLKLRTSKAVLSLRNSAGVGEGKFDPPGLFEFSSYMGRKEANRGSAESLDQNIDDVRVATIRSIEKILGQPSNHEQKIELNLRLAELHAERHSYFLVRGMSRYERDYERWEKNHRSGPEPRMLLTESQRSMTLATEILRKIVNLYPNHARTPEALRQLGFLLTEMKSDSAVLYFQRLLERFPKSAFVPDALLAMGEFYFSRNRFADALVYYQKILNDRNHHVYPYAVYKLGWTFFNIRGTEAETKANLEKSLSAFKLLVAFSSEKRGKNKLSLLRKDALRDMVLVFAELGAVDEAQLYFKTAGEYSLYTTLLERLAWLHADSGRNREAVEVYSRLVSEFPDSAKNPVYYTRLAALFDKEQKRPQLVAAFQQFSEDVTDGSRWWKARSKAEDRADAVKLIVSESHLWGVRLHAEFQKTRNTATAQSAVQLYQTALRHQPDSGSSYQSLFNMAQLHSALEEHEKAVEVYYRVAQLDRKFSLKRPESKIAIENAIAEADILFGRKRQSASGKSSHLGVLELRLVSLVDLHSQLFPKAPERPEFQHRAALLHFNAGLTEEAARRWTSMARDYPQNAFVSEGLRLVIKRSFDSGDWLKAAADARAFLSLPSISSAPVSGQLRKLLSVAVFQQGMHLDKNRRHAEAAKQFLAYHREFQADADAPKALINAANNQFRDNRPEDALSTLKIFTGSYPASEYSVKALEMTAVTSQSLGLFSDAAHAFEMIAKRKSAGEAAAPAHFKAAEMHLAAGQNHAAIVNSSLAATHLKDAGEACEAYKILVDARVAAKTGGLHTTALAALDRCRNSSPEWGLYFGGLAAKLSLAAGQTGDAVRLASQTLLRGKRSGGKLQNTFAFEGLRLAGHVQLGVLELQSKQLLARRVRNTSVLHSEFPVIRSEAEKLIQKYVEIVQSGQPEALVTAIFRVGEIQEGLASILVQTPLAEGISPSEAESVRSKIEKIALPLQEEAGKLFSQALEKSEDLEVSDTFARTIRERLSATRPAEFSAPVGTMPPPSYFMHELPVRDEVKEVVDESN